MVSILSGNSLKTSLDGLIDVKNNEYQTIKIYGDVNDDGQVFFKIYYIDDNQNKILTFNRETVTNYAGILLRDALGNTIALLTKQCTLPILI